MVYRGLLKLALPYSYAIILKNFSMKNLLVPIIVSALLLTACSTDTEPNATSAPSVSQNTLNIPVQPEKKTDLYGKILSMEGNEITVLQSDTSKDPTFNMLPDEKKKYMAALDESARTALKAEINAATLGEVRITVPVGIGMVKKTAQ